MHLSEIWHSKKNDSRLSRTQVPLCLASLVIYKKHGHQQFYLENMGYLDNSDSPYSYVAQADREKYRKRWLKRINKLIYEVRYMVEKDKSLNEKNDKK